MKKIFGLLMTVYACGAGSQAAGAQIGNESIAAGGPHGVYITVGRALCSKVNAVDGVAGYLIERKSGLDAPWRTIARCESPTTKEEFVLRLGRSMSMVPAPFSLRDVPVEKIWEKVARYHRLDSVGAWGGLLAVRLALDVVYYDTTAQIGVKYQYRVSRVDRSGTPLASMVSDPVSYPLNARLAIMRNVRRSGDDSAITLRWLLGAGKRPALVHTYRRKGLTNEFETIDPRVTVGFEGRAITFTVRDTLVAPRAVYQYYLLPFDYYGNPGEPSDTVLAASFDFSRIAPPADVHATGIDSASGIAIRWILQDPTYIRSVHLYRSELWDSGYVKIAEVSPQQAGYLDQRVEPMKGYFYYVRMIGLLGEESPPSVRTRGEFRSGYDPFPPTGLTAESIPGGVRLQWHAAGESAKGFYVYRSGAGGDDFKQISPLIHDGGTTTFYCDTSALSGRYSYAYAVRTEGSSNRLSPFSDTVYARPGIDGKTTSPTGLKAYAEGRAAQLWWDDMYRQDATIQGYLVYRRETRASEKSAPDFKLIVGSPLPPQQNHYLDTTLLADGQYDYVLRTVDIAGNRSEQSIAVHVGTRPHGPLPPGGVRAVRQSKGIRIEWEESVDDGITGYRVYRYERTRPATLVAEVKSDSPGILDARTEMGKLYFYYVTSVRGKNAESHPSNEVGIRR